MKMENRRIFFYWLFGASFFLALCSFSWIGPPQKSPYRQIRIPLNVQSGVPFSKDERGEYHIQGFEIDSNGNIYFLGGQKASLACFTKDGKAVYRKSYLNLVPGEMAIFGSSLYVFEMGDKLLYTIAQIDRTSGAIVREYPKTIAAALKARAYQVIDYYEFKDSMLKISYVDSEGIKNTKLICFNLKGELLPDCPVHAPAAIENEMGYEHLGKLGNNFVMGKFDDDGKRYLLSLRDASNRSLADTFVERRFLGDPFCGHLSCMPPDHRKVRNNKLYLLNRDGNMAEVTVIDLAAIFKRKQGSS